MKARHKRKTLKNVAEKHALHMCSFGYTAEIAKMSNGVDYVVRAENKYEQITIIIDRLKHPFNTWTMKKKGVVKL